MFCSMTWKNFNIHTFQFFPKFPFHIAVPRLSRPTFDMEQTGASFALLLPDTRQILGYLYVSFKIYNAYTIGDSYLCAISGGVSCAFFKGLKYIFNIIFNIDSIKNVIHFWQATYNISRRSKKVTPDIQNSKIICVLNTQLLIVIQLISKSKCFRGYDINFLYDRTLIIQ